MLPGPPRELRPMFKDAFLPWLQTAFADRPAFASRTLKTSGLGESLVEERLLGPLAAHRGGGVDLAFCARMGEVEVRLSASGADAAKRVAAAVAAARENLQGLVFGEEDDTLEGSVVRRLTETGGTLATVESCTGGLIAHRITNVPGASVVFLAGYVTYANAAKTSAVGVPADLLAAHGAVSEPVARAMAEGARARSGADYALATTGIAGPGGGTPEKPVGTVWLALAGPGFTDAWRQNNPHDRETFKQATSQQALMALYRRIVQGS
jgi:nicotinamide-nucleotide amidase